MKRVLIPVLLVLAMLFSSIPGLTEGDETITLEVKTDNLPIHDAADPLLTGLLNGETDPLPVLLLAVKKSCDIRATVQPANLRNKRFTLTVENEEIAGVRGNRITGVKAGETLLTVASEENPAAKEQFRVLVIQPVSRIDVTASEKSVAAGSSIMLNAEITPENASIRKIRWSSANEQIATVDENGMLTGVKRGNVRVVATAEDGSNTRANFNIKVTQSPESVTTDKTEASVDASRQIVLKATVLPREADDKAVIWTSSDESVATVNNQGRVTGVALGECDIICTCHGNEAVQCKVRVRVTQPVKEIIFDEAPEIWAGETGKLSWVIEPGNASNPDIALTSANKKILTVSEDGTVTGIQRGEAFVNAVSTDGSNRRARVKVAVKQHVTGMSMNRKIAYIDVGESAKTRANLEPKNASNTNVSWESADPAIAKVATVPHEGNRVLITGVKAGETTVTGITEDGGFQDSLTVKIGDWDHALTLTKAYVQGADVYLTVRNDSDLTITKITAEVSVYNNKHKPVPANKKNDSNTFSVVFRKTLYPGESTKEKDWKYVDFMLPDSPTVSEYVVKIVEYQIDNDWIKLIRKKNQPTKKCPVHV